MSNSMHRST